MALLDSNIVEQLKGYFDNINGNIELVSFLDDSEKSNELDSFLKEVDVISEKVNYIKKSFENDKTDLEKANITRPISFESVNKPINIETFISLSCTHCPDVVQALNLISTNNKNITTTMVDSAVFFEEAKEKDIQAVPVVFINGEQKSVGAKTMEELINLVINA